MIGKMRGATLPGDSTVAFRDFEIPKSGHGQVLVKAKWLMRAWWSVW